MLEAFHRLRRADEPPRAAAHHIGLAGFLVDLAQRRRAADRADVRELIGLAVLGPLLQANFEDLRNDVARPLHDDGVADADVLPRDLVLVVERGVRNDDAADGHRFQPRNGRQRAGAPDVDFNGEHRGRRALGGELVRGRPAGAARDEAEPLLQGEVVDLVDDAVDVVAEIGAARLDGAVMLQHLLGGAAELRQRIDRQAEALHRVHRSKLCRGDGLADLPPGVSEKSERARGGDARVELAQRPRRGVARVGEHRLAGLRLPAVERGEVGMAHINFASRFEDAGSARETLRDRVNGPHIGGDVLALVAVAPRRRLHEFAVLVAQRTGKSVDLRLGDHVERRVVGQARGSGARARKTPRPPRRRKYCRAKASAPRDAPWRIFPTARRRPLRLSDCPSPSAGNAASNSS